jgi:hypothetical protein
MLTVSHLGPYRPLLSKLSASEVLMPIKRKSKAKSSTSKKSKKTSKKSTLKKVKITKKAASKKKTAAKKPVRRTAASVRKMVPVKKATVIEPGPPPRQIPPVEEPAVHETAVGTVTHYYSHLGVAVIQINAGTLKIGDKIHIKGNSTDLIQTVESMEYEHQHIDQASAGQSVGMRVADHTREHDIVYVVK